MSSLFKYLSQTAPVKTGPVNARVRPAKPSKREKGKGRRGVRTPRDGKISVARGKERERDREERDEREEDFPPPASSRDVSNFHREETRGERRGKMLREREEDSE